MFSLKRPQWWPLRRKRGGPWEGRSCSETFPGVTMSDTSQRASEFQQQLGDLHHTKWTGNSADLGQSALEEENTAQTGRTGAVLLFNTQNNNASEAFFLDHWQFMNSKAWKQNLNYYKQRERETRLREEGREGGKAQSQGRRQIKIEEERRW